MRELEWYHGEYITLRLYPEMDRDGGFLLHRKALRSHFVLSAAPPYAVSFFTFYEGRFYIYEF